MSCGDVYSSTGTVAFSKLFYDPATFPTILFTTCHSCLAVLSVVLVACLFAVLIHLFN